MGEVTGPVRPLSAMSGADMLAVMAEEAAAEFRRAQMLYRELLRGEVKPAAEVIEHSDRIADLDLAIRKASMFETARGPLETPPLAAVPGRHRRSPRQRTGDRPLLRSVPWRS